MLWTNEGLLSQIALSLTQDPALDAMLPLSPSSTIVLEFTQESTDTIVRTFINDNLVKTIGCSNND
jgi:hypothetical protein